MITAQPIEVVRLWDPAIDHDASDMVRYAQTRDMAHVKFIAGMQPVRFWVRRIPRSCAAQFVRATNVSAEQRLRAFSVGLLRVENFATMDGQHVRDWRPATKAEPRSAARGGYVLTDDELDLFSEGAIEEIGAVVSQLSFLCQDSGAHFVPPPSSVDAWEGARYRFAERKALSALPSSGEAKAPPADADTNTSASRGDEPTDAIAMESLTAA